MDSTFNRSGFYVVVSLEEITCGNLITLDFERQYNVTFVYHISVHKIKYKSIKCNTF